jgi:hypothetical protein
LNDSKEMRLRFNLGTFSLNYVIHMNYFRNRFKISFIEGIFQK